MAISSERSPFPQAACRSGVRVKPKAIYLMEAKTFPTVYGPEERDEIARLLDVEPVPREKADLLEHPSLLRDVEIIISSWGAATMDATFLQAAPRLRAVFYGAGSVRAITTPEFWRRNITVTSAFAANAQPVAEMTLGLVLLSLKRFWSFARSVKAETDPWGDHNRVVPGVYHSTVGLLSCGMVARKLIHFLKDFDVRCVVYDPFMTERDASTLGVEICSLPEVFERSDVVSIHTPYLPETAGLVTGRLIDSMKAGATLINTARGGLIREPEMTEVLSRRDDLTAILDVSDPEPPLPGARLIHLPNVWMTPHIAGSLGPECRRLGRCMVDEVRRYLAGEPLLWPITEESARRMA